MEDIPVSFSWIYPKNKSESKFTAYCFAYIRDSKTYNTLYAGVKFTGKISDLKFYKPSLRKTAIERLIEKPIFAIVNLGDEENYSKNLSDPEFRFNGLNETDVPKKSIALGKFFLHCALNQEYSNLGISANKKFSDFRFVYVNEKYEFFTGQKERSCYVKYGYEFKNSEIKRITNVSSEVIFNLRKRAKFYGTGGQRKSIEEYFNLEEDFLKLMGIYQRNNEKIEVKLRDYIMDKRVIFYRINLSRNTQAHIALMDFDSWENFASEVYGKDINIDIPGLVFNTYCIGFVITKNYSNLFEKKIFRKIAVDRMIDRPTIIDADFFEKMKVKDIRKWVGDRIGYFSTEGIGRIDYNDDLYLESDLILLNRYDEIIRVYQQTNRPINIGGKIKNLVKWIRGFF